MLNSSGSSPQFHGQPPVRERWRSLPCSHRYLSMGENVAWRQAMCGVGMTVQVFFHYGSKFFSSFKPQRLSYAVFDVHGFLLSKYVIGPPRGLNP
ncbi:hypothetical protein J6590_049635 [Homalodisca vitripennis]|nr:hypothetical protein J6590_049635 [Homalodisca vitripennis]